ncbi:hypothetical protein BDK51DRAFT_26377 [Blyttiomyces helicus]|uniref:Uncharacterized protein n=1 Tax=Blyttiomyces helicus TaxID=388810 RepID=A0A4P9W8T1_9FUNG|nr:hypothetical protein BDK51DRAFT_26377 [Blyttiomyces helicus]|eukprot:RKO88939.1 hypothetical protein BDK51DRAFT_26377 [Blyttiomyces helicus]
MPPADNAGDVERAELLDDFRSIVQDVVADGTVIVGGRLLSSESENALVARVVAAVGRWTASGSSPHLPVKITFDLYYEYDEEIPRFAQLEGRDRAMVKILKEASGNRQLLDLHLVALMKTLSGEAKSSRPYCLRDLSDSDDESDGEDAEFDEDSEQSLDIGVWVDEGDAILFDGMEPTDREYEGFNKYGYVYDGKIPTLTETNRTTLLVVSPRNHLLGAPSGVEDRPGR